MRVKQKLYSLEELEKELGVAARWEESLEESQADRKVSERTEERLHRLSLTFNREHDYRITPWCRDLAEKEGGKDRGIKGETQKFVIDRTPPVIQVSFVDRGRGTFLGARTGKRQVLRKNSGSCGDHTGRKF